MRKICIYGLSGAGKTTTTTILSSVMRERGERVAIVNLAEPLYRLQSEIYAQAGRKIESHEQDQLLLESIAGHLRRINPHALIADFRERLDRETADSVINCDLRDPHVDYVGMRDLGFRFVRVCCDEALRCDRLKRRGDLSTVVDSETTRELDLIKPDLSIENSSGALEELESQIRSIEHLI